MQSAAPVVMIASGMARPDGFVAGETGQGEGAEATLHRWLAAIGAT